MRYLPLGEVLLLHARVLEQSGGGRGLRDLGALQSALAQPTMTFGDRDLYPSVETKAAALAYSLVMNHPFVDGNKRIGHAAMEVFLVLNGFEIAASIDSAEGEILALAAGKLRREDFLGWVERHVVPLK